MSLGKYPIQFRAQVLKSALYGYDKIKEQNNKNIKPMYGSKDWIEMKEKCRQGRCKLVLK